jgi:methyltransferase (TIGR00027 family)
VVLGAGFDTFAQRRTDLQDRLQIFEVDHPATQQSKRARLSAAGLTIPSNLHFLPADFEHETVLDVLQRCPEYRSGKTAFFSWLGVTMYLAREAIAEVLHSIRRATQVGSHLVFDYIDMDGFDAASASPRITRMMEITRKVGEPMVFGFEPARLPADLASFGFKVVEAIGPKTIQMRYFDGRNDGLRATEHVHLVLAEVDNRDD